MASLRIDSRKDGTACTRVLFRQEGKQRCLTFDDHAVARRFRDLVDQVGADRARRSPTSSTSPASVPAPSPTTRASSAPTSNRRSARCHSPRSHVTTSRAGCRTCAREGRGRKTIANKHAYCPRP